MSRRTKIIIMGAVTLAILVLLILWLMLRSKAGAPAPSAAEISTLEQAAAPQAPTVPLSRATTEVSTSAPTAQAVVEAVARSFAERYGSYSNQSNFENIENLFPFMTDAMRVKEEANLARLRGLQDSSASYSGVTTQVLNVKTLSRSNSGAMLRLTTQRTESGTSLAQPRIYYQDIELALQAIDDQWKVDEALWK